MRLQRRPDGTHFHFPTVDQSEYSTLLDVVNISIPFTSPCDENIDDDGEP